jgi:thiamine-phosphate pyrophosphorylase
MHKYLPKIYCFVEKFDNKELQTINKSIGIIYRNYEKKVDEKEIIAIKQHCKKNKKKIFLANNLKIAIKLKLDGVYIPSFYKRLNTKNYTMPSKFAIIGSAHNEVDIKIKEKQGCSLVFLAPIFQVKKKNNYLNIHRFNKLCNNNKIKLIALGGINNSNVKKINLLNCYGFAGISWVKKNGLNKFRPFLNCLNRFN